MLLQRVLRFPLKLRLDASGNVAIFFALALPVVVGGAAFGVETSYWYLTQNQLQAAADAAAYAAAIEDRTGAELADVERVAGLTASENGFDLGSGQITVTPETVDGGGQVEVLLERAAPRFFTAFFLAGEMEFAARAVAAYNSASNACILALDPTASAAAKFSGSSTLTLDGCSVMANSTAADALYVQGAASLTTDCAISGGGVTENSGLTLTQCKAPITQAPPVADPYKDLATPDAPSGCATVPVNGAITADKRFCNGMTFKGDVTLAPGVYYVSGDLVVNATASVKGSGVTFFITDGGHVKMSGSPHVALSAPTSGAYSGILFFGDRSVSGGTNKFLGDGASGLTGAIYFPSQEVSYQGSFSGADGCTQVIGRTVQWTGNAQISADCSDHGMAEIPVLNIVRLTA